MQRSFRTTERIQWLKAHRNDPACKEEIPVRDRAYAWAEERYADEPVQIRRAMGFAETLRRKRILIPENDLLAGYHYKYTYNTNFPMIVSPDFDPAGRASFKMDVRREIREASELPDLDFKAAAEPGHQDIPDADGTEQPPLQEFLDAAETWLIKHWHSGHTAAGYEMLLREGCGGLLEKANRRLAECSNPDEAHNARAFVIVLESCIEYIERYVREAELQMEALEALRSKTDEKAHLEKRLAELLSLHSDLKQICLGAPRSFRQAIQLVSLAHEMMYCENVPSAVSLGRLDQYLYPFYTADIRDGRITPEQASELIDDFWIKCSVQRKAYQNLTLGGCDQRGRSAFNELTYMCLDSAARLRVDQPSVNFRWTEDMTDDQWQAVLKLIRTGMGFPAIFYDSCCIRAQLDAGIDAKDAWDYGFIGCVELTVPGRENAYTELARLNLPKLLDILLHEGTDGMTGVRFPQISCRRLEEITTYEELETLFFRELEGFVRRMAGCLDVMERLYAERYPLPYLSVLTESCIERGKDVNAGGAKYSSAGFNLCGAATAADSLAAIKRMVFEEKKLTLRELSNLLENGFAGSAHLREYAVHRCPKFGNDEAFTDGLVSQMYERVADIIAEYRTHTGGHYRLGLYTVEDHAIMGQHTGATADGRPAGQSLSNSTGAVQGRDTNGPTALINSVTQFPMARAQNGMVLDIKFPPEVISGDTGDRALRALIRSYFRKGGMEVQISAVSQKQLLEAQKRPEEYEDLIVRVSGFSAYFTTLRKTTQDEIIARSSIGTING